MSKKTGLVKYSQMCLNNDCVYIHSTEVYSLTCQGDNDVLSEVGCSEPHSMAVICIYTYVCRAINQAHNSGSLCEIIPIDLFTIEEKSTK